MFRWVILSTCAVLFASTLSGQHYTSKKYQVSVVPNMVYGIDTAYNGKPDTLKFDLYKPLGDTNCRRPIMVVVHGGAWIAGDKADGGIVSICREFAQRGYVVASVNYRMGMHPAAYYVPYAVCVHAKCSYVADSAEYYRASFRAGQDVKGAIRFMKNRSGQDSSDHNQVYLLGESAGAFTTNIAAFMDRDVEKPSQCFALADAPTPDSDLSSCNVSGTSPKRPDLGSVRGRLNMQLHNEKVQGVAAFYGGVFDTALFRNASPTDTPDLYLFHQTCDVVVDNNKGRIFWKVFNYCYDPVNLCMPFSTGPVSYGSTAIKQFLDTANLHKPRMQYTLLTDKGAYSCNPSDNCHGIDNTPNRCAQVAQFFATKIAATGNTPGTDNCTLGNGFPRKRAFHIYPNAAMDHVMVDAGRAATTLPTRCTLTGIDGRVIAHQTWPVGSAQFRFELPQHLQSGTYFMCIESNESVQCEKLIKTER
jgi:acetyl esterase/lipase